MEERVSCLPNDCSKLKRFADFNFKNVAKLMAFAYDRGEDIVGKGENAGYQHFLLFPQCFRKAFCIGPFSQYGQC